jgi:hypothetical protein
VSDSVPSALRAYTRRPNDRLSGGELGEIPVIARSEATKQSPARESRCTRRVGDCFVVLLLIPTTLGPVDKPVLAPRWLGGVTPTWPRGVTR